MLNRKILGRGYGARVLLSGCCLQSWARSYGNVSCSARALLNALLVSRGPAAAVECLTIRVAMFVYLVSIWRTWVLHAHSLAVYSAIPITLRAAANGHAAPGAPFADHAPILIPTSRRCVLARPRQCNLDEVLC